MRKFLLKIQPYWYMVVAFLAVAIAVTTVFVCVAAGPALYPEAAAAQPSTSRSDISDATASPTPSPLPPESPEPTPDHGFTGFSYNDAVPERAPVENDWFDDAVFLGDSRTDGFRLHSGLTTSRIYGEKSISVFNAASEARIRLDNGEYGTLLDALAQHSCKKVYIMLGINELGYRAEAYGEKYAELAQQVRALQPEADIYIQAIIPVTGNRAEGDSVYNNENIQAFNQQLATVCEDGGYHYVDTYSAFADENGALPEDLSWDGIHLTAEGYVAWLDYLKTHTLENDQ